MGWIIVAIVFIAMFGCQIDLNVNDKYYAVDLDVGCARKIVQERSNDAK